MSKFIERFEYMVVADNSSGFQTMSATACSDGVSFTVLGCYEGEEIQLDFNSLSGLELEHFIDKLYALKATYEKESEND